MIKFSLFFAITFLLYLPAINGPYTLDDLHTIQSNASIHSVSNALNVWTSAKYYSDLPPTWGYRPVMTFTNLVLWAVGGGKTWPFHLFKFFIFAGICVLLLEFFAKLVPQLDPKVLWLGTLLFAVNPVHSQVLSYISATSTLLTGFLILLCLHFYLHYRTKQKKSALLAAVVTAALAVLCKEEGIVVIALLVLFELYLRKIENKKIFEAKAYSSMLPILVGVGISLALLVLMYEPTTQMARGQVPVYHYFLTQLRAYIRYFEMFFVSYDLNIDNLAFGFSSTLNDIKTLLALLINLVLIGGSIFLFRKNPIYLFILAWFYIAISPASSFVPLAEPVNDHRAFIGYFGFAILTLLALQTLFKRSPRLAYGVFATVAMAYSTHTFARSFDWRSDITIWQDTVKKNPQSARAKNNLAVALMREQRLDEALVLLEQCSTLIPNYSNCYINKAAIFAALGQDDLANLNFQRAADFDKTFVQSHLLWSKFLLGRGFLQQSLDLLLKADQFVHGQNFELRLELIEVLRQMGNSAKALELWNESIQTFGRNVRLVELGQKLGGVL